MQGFLTASLVQTTALPTLTTRLAIKELEQKLNKQKLDLAYGRAVDTGSTRKELETRLDEVENTEKKEFYIHPSTILATDTGDIITAKALQ